MPKHQNDDWHWLAAALDVSHRRAGAPLVVTNDIARDHHHHWATQQEKYSELEVLSAEYRELHLARFHFSYLGDGARQATLERGVPFELYVYEPRQYVQRAQRYGAQWLCPVRPSAQPPDLV